MINHLESGLSFKVCIISSDQKVPLCNLCSMPFCKPIVYAYCYCLSIDMYIYNNTFLLLIVKHGYEKINEQVS